MYTERTTGMGLDPPLRGTTQMVNLKFVLSTLITAFFTAIVMASPAQAEDESFTVASGYLFTDFNFQGSDLPVANFSTNFRAPLGMSGNLWIQVGEDTISREIDLTGSTPRVSFGPLNCGATAGVYWTPELDNFTIPTVWTDCSMELAGVTLVGKSQWYWDDLEDQRFQVSVGRTFTLTDRVGLDVAVGQSRIDSSGARPNFLVIGLPITMEDERTIRPFGKFGWGGDDDLNVVGGLQFNW